ncbi:carboxypeptidase-like regulatory domain-containing protein [Hymenobacter coccineus]|uniref:TonB-dependent receptor plug domain-containing protein n=1 Tax=Hymenobacter coccineus TaxID=1908235 RepID=A0A1G1SY67_9BACT|nr:carboxypeptidase-like regulatory domain-containing protein [Hymenobacter coccineus]OGX83568.1 hypothetical protein BEN49_02095 [Hymenobacter coccineus]
MAARRTTVHIPQPCAESWAAMTPRGPGRHCAACQQTVVDFTQKTNGEILAMLKQATGNTCGRFAAGQLGRPLQPLAVGAPSRWRAWLAAAVAVWGLREGVGTVARAQVPTELRPLRAPATVPATTGPSKYTHVISGVVTDSATHEGAPGVSVILMGTTFGTSTDATGHFRLELPDSLIRKSKCIIGFSWVGYARQELALSSFTEPVEVVLRPDQQALGGIVVVGDYSHRPWPWHPRRFYYWSKYWLTQAFRQS